MICFFLVVDCGFGWKDNVEEFILYVIYIFQYVMKYYILFELFISVLVEGGVLYVLLNEG